MNMGLLAFNHLTKNPHKNNRWSHLPWGAAVKQDLWLIAIGMVDVRLVY